MDTSTDVAEKAVERLGRDIILSGLKGSGQSYDLKVPVSRVAKRRAAAVTRLHAIAEQARTPRAPAGRMVEPTGHGGRPPRPGETGV